MRTLFFLLAALLAASRSECAEAPARRVLTQFAQMANHVVTSADGKTVASSSSWAESHKENGRWVNALFGAITICDIETSRAIRTLNSPRVGDIALSPAGNLLALVIWEAPTHKVEIWDVKTGQLLKTLTAIPNNGVQQEIRGLVFSPNGKVLATATVLNEQHENFSKWVGGTIQLWDVETGRMQREIQSGEVQMAVTRPTFSADGSILAGVAISTEVSRMKDADAHCEIKSWDARTGNLLRTQSVPCRDLQMLAFTPKGRLLAAGLVGNQVQLWDAASGKRLQALDAKKSDPQSLVLSPDGNTLATAGLDSVIRLWDVQTGQLRRALWEHGKWINALAFPPGRNALVSAGADGAVTLWDLSSPPPENQPVREPRLLIGADSSFSCAKFSSDGTLLVTGGDSALLWDIQTLSLKRRFTVSGPQVSAVNAKDVAVSTDKQRVAARLLIYEDRGTKAHTEVHVWNAQTGETLAVMPLTDKSQDVAFSPDCRTFATLNEGHTLCLWDLLTGKLLCSWERPQSYFTGFQFSRDGATVVFSTSGGKGIEWWNVSSRKQAGFLAAGALVVLTPSGQPLLTQDVQDGEGLLQMWKGDANKMMPRFQMNVGSDSWQKTSVSADGALLAVSRHLGGNLQGNDMEVRLWDISTGQSVGCLAELGTDPHFVALSPDGKTLAVPTGGTMIRLWDISHIQQGIAQ